MAIEPTAKKELVDSIGRVNSMTVTVDQVDFDPAGTNTKAGYNSKIHGTATSVSGNGVTGETDFNFNRIDIGKLGSVVSTSLPAQPMASTHSIIPLLNRICKTEFTESDIVQQTIDLKGIPGETFRLSCTTTSTRYTGSLIFTLQPTAPTLIIGEMTVVKGTTYRIIGTAAGASYPDSPYSTLLLNGVEHPIGFDGTFTVTVETGLVDFHFSANAVYLFGRNLPITKITKLLNYGDSLWSLSGAFRDNKNLVEVGDEVFKGNKQPIDLSFVFSGCSSLTTVGMDFLNFPGGVSNFASAFSNCVALTSIGDTDVGIAIQPYADGSNMFNYCMVLAKVPAKWFKGASRCTTLSAAFQSLGSKTALGTDLPSGLLLECGAVTTIANAFNLAKVSSWPLDLLRGLTALTGAGSAFAKSNITVLPEGYFGNSPALFDVTSCFQGTIGLDIQGALFASGVRLTATSMFSAATIAALSVDIFKGTVITNASSMFNSAIVRGDFPNVFPGQTSITTTLRMFASASIAFTAANATLLKDSVNITTVEEMFYGTTFRNGVFPVGFFSTLVNVATVQSCFRGVKGGDSVLVIPAGLFDNQSKATDFRLLFVSSSNISFQGSVLPKAKSATTLYNSFGGCGATQLPADLLAYSDNVTNASRCFEGSPVSDFPATMFAAFGNCLDMSSIFSGATGFTTLPADLFKACAKVTTMANGFYSLKQPFKIPAGFFDGLTALASIQYLFRYSISLDIPAGLFAKNANLTVISSPFDRVALSGDLTNMFSPSLGALSPQATNVFNGMTLTNMVVTGRMNFPVSGLCLVGFGNSVLPTMTVDQLINLLGLSATNKITVAANAQNLLLNCKWVTGSKATLVKALWQVDDASKVSDADITKVLSGTTNLT